MLTGKLKYLTIALMVVVFIVLSMIIYRMYWKFKPSKVKTACEKIASTYADSQTVYQLLIEGCEEILKSADKSKQVEILAKAEGVELETYLAIISMNKLIALKMIEAVQPLEVGASTPGISE